MDSDKLMTVGFAVLFGLPVATILAAVIMSLLGVTCISEQTVIILQSIIGIESVAGTICLVESLSLMDREIEK